MNTMNKVHVEHNPDIGSAASLGLPQVDFKIYHDIVLPNRLHRGVSDKIAWDVAQAPPIALQTPDGGAYSYVHDNGRVRIVPGVSDDAELAIELLDDSWDNYYYEMRTRFGLLFSRKIRFVRGDFMKWDAWEPALRCLYSGTPIFDPRKILLDLDGSPLDISKSFNRDDDPRLMSHFLNTAGYLHVRNVYSKSEIARLSDEIDRLRAQAVEGDPFSRWAEDSNGRKAVYDLHYMGVQSKLARNLESDPRLTVLTGLSGNHLVPSFDRDNGTHAILRELTGGGSVDSQYVLEWHRDCGLGGCPITCPRYNVGVQLDAATPESSQLYFLAGTSGTVCHDRTGVMANEAEWDTLPIVALETAEGDVTVHSSCALHAAPKVNGRKRRRTVYVRFSSPLIQEFLKPFETFDQVIPGVGGDQKMPSDNEMTATAY